MDESLHSLVPASQFGAQGVNTEIHWPWWAPNLPPVTTGRPPPYRRPGFPPPRWLPPIVFPGDPPYPRIGPGERMPFSSPLPSPWFGPRIFEHDPAGGHERWRRQNDGFKVYVMRWAGNFAKKLRDELKKRLGGGGGDREPLQRQVNKLMDLEGIEDELDPDRTLQPVPDSKSELSHAFYALCAAFVGGTSEFAQALVIRNLVESFVACDIQLEGLADVMVTLVELQAASDKSGGVKDPAGWIDPGAQDRRIADAKKAAANFKDKLNARRETYQKKKKK